jgi:nucleoside-diphosphate-sugar epimerase
MPSSYFVTGATGLVGSRLCGALLAEGNQVRALLRDPSTAEIDPGVEPVRGDVADAESVKRGARGADAVVHCAAILGGVAGRFDPIDYERINLQGTINALEAAGDVPVVIVSTIAALQNGTDPVTETSRVPERIDDESPYTRTKRLALIEVERRVAAGQVDARVVVPGGVYGPAPAIRRALAATSFNNDVRRAIRERYRATPGSRSAGPTRPTWSR